MTMQNEEKEAVAAFAQKFWDIPGSTERFHVIDSEVREDVDSLLSCGNVALMNRCVTTAEQSVERRLNLGLPILEFEGD